MTEEKTFEILGSTYVVAADGNTYNIFDEDGHKCFDWNDIATVKSAIRLWVQTSSKFYEIGEQSAKAEIARRVKRFIEQAD